jgi:hypothetical protein
MLLSQKNNKIPIKITEVVKNEAPRGSHSPVHDQRSYLKL